MHEAAKTWVRRFVLAHGPGTRVLEIGSREINGEVRSLFRKAESYTGIDLAPGAGVDLVADGATFVLEAPPDRIVCCEVLEHAPNAAAILANAWRQLAPHGWLVVTCAAPNRAPHSAVDGGPLRPGEFYRNLTPRDVHDALKPAPDLHSYDLDELAGDLRVAAWKGPKRDADTPR